MHVLEGGRSTEGYKMGIKKMSGNEYTGFIIEAASARWKAGDIKFRLFPDGSFEYSLLDRSKKKRESDHRPSWQSANYRIKEQRVKKGAVLFLITIAGNHNTKRYCCRLHKPVHRCLHCLQHYNKPG
jgi:hypothetical protein